MRLFLFFLLCFCIQLQTFAVPIPKTYFVKNEGQWENSILFRAEIPGGFLLIKNTGLYYTFLDFPEHGSKKLSTKLNDQVIKGHRLSVEFSNTNAIPQVETPTPLSAKFNYFIGNDPSKWQQSIPTFDEITLKNVYPNVDFRLYSIDQSLKYEFIAHPQADISKISMKYSGAESLVLDEKEGLHIKTSINTFKEFQPYSYQKIAGVEKTISSKFSLKNNQVFFDLLDNYNKNETLVIDPQLVFSTYSGSKSDNWGHTSTFDADGNMFVGGTIFGSDFPTTTGAFQVNSTGNNGPFTFSSVTYQRTDMVLMKFSADGTQLLYGTYLGGKESDVPLSLICNSKGELVVFGTTGSKDYPVASNAFQKNFGGGSFWSASTEIGFNNGSDICVSVLSKNGDKLVGSTYIGGSQNDGFSDTHETTIQNYGDEFRGEVTLDSLDNIYFTSSSSSLDFPVKNAFQTTKFGDIYHYDAVVCKLSPYGSDLLWSTYLGGDGLDIGYGIKVAQSRSVYVAGLTTSANLPTKSAALKQKLSGKTDGFLAKFTQNNLEQLSYLGTNNDDIADFVELDKQENVYVYGISKGAYPVVGDVYRNEKSGQFIHCLDKNLSKTIFSTVIGTGNSSYDTVPTAFLVNDCGNIYIAGWGGNVDAHYNTISSTKNLPITADAIQKTTTGNNFYVAILESGAKSLLYATYFGSSSPPANAGLEVGDHLDGGTCRFDKNGVIYHAACSCKSRGGTTSVATFPVTPNAYQQAVQSNNCNMAGFKIDLQGLKAKFDIISGGVSTNQVCAPAKVDFVNASVGGKTYEWQINGQVVSRTQNPTQVPFTTAGDYVVKLIIYNPISCQSLDSTQKTITVKTFDAQVSADTVVCAGASVQLSASGGDTYAWTPAGSLNNASLANPVAKVTSTTKFTVTISNSTCKISKDVVVTIDPSKTAFQVSNSQEVCAGQSITLQASGNAANFTWSSPNLKETTAKSITITPTQSITYVVNASFANGCTAQKNIALTIDNSYKPDFDLSIVQDCIKPLQLNFTNTTQNATKMVWAMGNGDSLQTVVPENYKYAKAGTYKITLTSYNKMGCSLSTTKTFYIPDANTQVPNVITPNNDGKNDTFTVAFKNASLMIYNRWGKLIFESANYQNDWGNGIEDGNYFYTLLTATGTECKGMIQVIN